jgi:hypothetical protein
MQLLACTVRVRSGWSVERAEEKGHFSGVELELRTRQRPDCLIRNSDFNAKATA